MDLLAAIQSVEPTAWPLLVALAIGLSLYPVGILMPCGPCCNGCDLCQEGSLPDTVTVTFSGMENYARGPDRVLLAFSSCFGFGATGRVLEPGGDRYLDPGPIAEVELTSGGSGYAQLGRVAPTITITGGGGSGAAFVPTLTETAGPCGIPTWSIDYVAVAGGTGYSDGDVLTVEAAVGDTVVSQASVRLNTRAAPTLSAAATGGTGATFSVTVEENPSWEGTWRIESVTVTAGGSGYGDGELLTITGGGNLVTLAAAEVRSVTGRIQPTVTAQAGGSGAGAVLAVTLAQDTGYGDGRTIWRVDSVAVTNGGSGYSLYDNVEAVIADGTQTIWSVFSAYVSEVDGNGAIMAVVVSVGGEYYKSNGIIEDVEVDYSGAYYDDPGVPVSVIVEDGGEYYQEDATEPPYVADVTVTIGTQYPSGGTGGSITATVDDDPESETFGQITGLAIAAGGDGYLAYELLAECLNRFNGRSIVLRRETEGTLTDPNNPLTGPTGNPCRYAFQCAQSPPFSVEQESVSFTYNGPGEPSGILVSIGHQRWNGPPGYAVNFGILTPSNRLAQFSSDGNISDCSALTIGGEPATFTGTVTTAGGAPYQTPATATLTPGGDYEATETCREIRVAVMRTIRWTVEFDGRTWEIEDGGLVGDQSCGDAGSYPSPPTGLMNDTNTPGVFASIGFVIPDQVCGDFAYVGQGAISPVLGDDCLWTYAVSLTMSRSEPPIGIGGAYESWEFAEDGPVSVDADGYPSGSISMRLVQTYGSPTAPGPETITLTATRILP